MAFFPFGLEKSLERAGEPGLWRCRFLIPRDQPDGRYEIDIWIMLPAGDWMRTQAEYVVDSTAPEFEVEAKLVGRTVHFRAVPAGGVFEAAAPGPHAAEGEARARVVPDVLALVVRPPHGGYVKLRPAEDCETGRAMVWTGTYELPEWYRPGRYSFRFQAVDEARNSFTRTIEVRVPAGGASAEVLEASR